MTVVVVQPLQLGRCSNKSSCAAATTIGIIVEVVVVVTQCTLIFSLSGRLKLVELYHNVVAQQVLKTFHFNAANVGGLIYMR